MITFKKLTQLNSDIYFDGELIGHIESIGDMFSVEVRYMSINVPKCNRRLVKGVIERLNKAHIHYQYKQFVKVHNLRNSKMYGKKYVEFQILD